MKTQIAIESKELDELATGGKSKVAIVREAIGVYYKIKRGEWWLYDKNGNKVVPI